MPYRTHESLIDGLVITFVDIDRIKRAQLEAEAHGNFAAGVIDALRDPLVMLDPQFVIVFASKSYYEMFRTTPKLGPFRSTIRRDFARVGRKDFVVWGTAMQVSDTTRVLVVLSEVT